MSTAIRISDSLATEAKLMSKIKKRSLTGQIEYWASIGKIAEENPDLPYLLIREIIIGTEEINQGEVSEYHFG
ncbi:MAG: ParD-like family protein [Bacteroidales bacterium]|nr:ParD-like family protein [Bacteroidales bacterium]